MEKKNRALAKFKSGLWVCWISLAILPLGIFLGAVGMCGGGPRSTSGAVAMLGLGVGGVLAGLYGGFNVLQGIHFGSWPLRIFGVVSLCSGLIVGFVGWFYALEARDYLDYLFHGGR
jgi:hypothetical protein